MHCEAEPPNYKDLVAKYNAKHGISPAESLPKFDLGNIEKARTQFDGVSHTPSVTYLQMKRNYGVQIPIMTTGITGKDIDFTVMFWFKVNEDFGRENSPSSEISYLFSFEDSASCFVTKTLSVMCDSYDRTKIQVSSRKLVPGRWYHLTLVTYDEKPTPDAPQDDKSTIQSPSSFLLIQDNNEIVGVAYSKYFKFRQA